MAEQENEVAEGVKTWIDRQRERERIIYMMRDIGIETNRKIAGR